MSLAVAVVAYFAILFTFMAWWARGRGPRINNSRAVAAYRRREALFGDLPSMNTLSHAALDRAEVERDHA
jgi:hypothetical protein